MSTLPRISPLLILAAALLVAACSPEQSANIGAQPKKTMDRVTGDANKALQQSGQDSERLKDADSK